MAVPYIAPLLLTFACAILPFQVAGSLSASLSWQPTQKHSTRLSIALSLALARSLSLSLALSLSPCRLSLHPSV